MYELKLLLHYAVFFLPAVMLERLAVNILYFSSATLRIFFLHNPRFYVARVVRETLITPCQKQILLLSTATSTFRER